MQFKKKRGKKVKNRNKRCENPLFVVPLFKLCSKIKKKKKEIEEKL